MLECLNSYSNLIVALAALVSAFFAGVIWWETRKYRQITTELKNLNHKLIEREKQNLQVTIPGLIKYFVGGLYDIPIWFTNLSSKPDSLLDLNIAVGDLKVNVHSDKKHELQLEMPLDEPINIDSLSSKVLYIGFVNNLRTEITLNLKYKSTDNIFQEKSVHFLLDKNKDFYKVKDNIDLKII